MANLTLYVPSDLRLPDNAQYTNRFEVKSETSNRKYTVAQNKSGRWWACGCSGWIRWKHCKHLRNMGLPGSHVPFEAKLESRNR